MVNWFYLQFLGTFSVRRIIFDLPKEKGQLQTMTLGTPTSLSCHDRPLFLRSTQRWIDYERSTLGSTGT